MINAIHLQLNPNVNQNSYVFQKCKKNAPNNSKLMKKLKALFLCFTTWKISIKITEDISKAKAVSNCQVLA
jgi:hypothetical protein